MCGRFAQPSLDALIDFYDAQLGGGFASSGARFNVAPTTAVAMLVAGSQGLELRAARWGLIPSWWRQEKGPASTFNARSETAATKPMFRAAFKRRRCLVPALAYYEWQKVTGDGGKPFKQPHAIARADERPLLMRGLWEPGGEEHPPSCTILTTAAAPELAWLHDRSPCLADQVDAAWLDPEFAEPDRQAGVLGPSDASQLRTWPVSTRVNRVGNEGEDLLADVSAGQRRVDP